MKQQLKKISFIDFKKTKENIGIGLVSDVDKLQVDDLDMEHFQGQGFDDLR